RVPARLAQPPAAGALAQAGDVQPDRAVHDLDLGFSLGSSLTGLAGRSLAALGVPRSGFRGASAAVDRDRRPLCDRAGARRGRVRVLGETGAREPLSQPLTLSPT